MQPDPTRTPDAASVPADDSPEFYEGTLMDGLDDEPAAATVVHEADVFELGDLTWKAVCLCGWECWNQPTAQAAWDTHEGHAHFETEVRNGR